MTADYDSHPSDLAGPGPQSGVTIDSLKKAIPKHCFKSSYRQGFTILFQDLSTAALLALLAIKFIPLIPSTALRIAAWAIYGLTQGFVFTGIWVIAHECGHYAFTPSKPLNDTLGFILHSFLLTPYFSWKSTHRRHHIYANNMALDHNYVPPRADEYSASFSSRIEDLTEDAPLVTALRILLQQLLGFPAYLALNITAAPSSLPAKPSSRPLENGHFAPWGALFRAEEAHLILASDAGLMAMCGILHYARQHVGIATVFAVYVVPYLWTNHWIVAITYLHHTHTDVPKYEADAWSFVRGATSTVDRDLGIVGRVFMHGIVDYHVVHHLFPRIPCYHAREATEAIVPVLGDAYHSAKTENFMASLWRTFVGCQYVVPRGETAGVRDGKLWYKGGRCPPVQTGMGTKRWLIWPDVL
ncbi:delta-12 fatty acid desaturas-like protein [Pseudovirgaria hyperparasitica]|uniref:Delta-12 fatty acid desaturas-like protein n=1 Tax=Pseudovirgaria hyperparasitica TaxID=470096 RepID=A0A6A6W963_9PEZI|nr:delta-12 fatty acid desaturas-like protein [Pseudovirgaria hyperparasitica]KAF2758480.1 delta-12 fatty acid desaturas-like protein [Pseudovirgaria hyperparasitica]